MFIFSGIEMPFIGKDKAFCMLDFSRIQLNKPAQRAFLKEFTKNARTAMQIWT